MDLIYVEWDDSYSRGDSGWTSPEEILEMPVALCQSVGWVLSRTDTHLTIVAHKHGPEDAPVQVTGEMVIPNSAIVSARVLKKGKYIDRRG